MKHLWALACAAALGLSASGASASDPDGNDRRVLVINEASIAIWELRGSNISRDTYEEDILGSETIAPGDTRVINFYDGTDYCRYDLKVTMRTGREVIRRDVDVCRLVRWRIRDGDDQLEF
ncbi:hypothetical protein EYB45_00585 [Erythrobacteraceae bacterium CFH 75059]|uniref:hypothetical protein n=1 Tax=Qipengyuania thermophila TaxID=2509361 RepID=UPI0010210739|nr:hypothetical protein [Qipengyuania thermophila]TCD06276.1 hypothetical protein EYB45_00585 [Erythrobacteraceae bacterium CFH 75059]